MMKKYTMKKWLLSIGCMVLIAAMALTCIGCGNSATLEGTPMEPTYTVPDLPEDSVIEMGEGEKAFSFAVEDLEGNKTNYWIRTDAENVGQALLDLGLLEGEEGPYGLYVRAVNGITAVYEEDGTYWAFYVDGEYGMTGVELTPIEEGKVYSFVQTKG